MNGNGTKILAGVIFVVSVVAYVYLDTRGGDTAGLMVLCGPVVAALVVDANTARRLEPVKQAAEQAVAQTNGSLDRRFSEHAEKAAERAATTVLERSGVVPPLDAGAP